MTNTNIACIHFNGTINQVCAAGVSYRLLAGEHLLSRLPCFSPEQGGLLATCEHHRWPTEDEIAAQEAEVEALLQRFNLAMPLILELKRDYKGRDVQVIKTCPVCGGKLHMSHASYNGHVWGKCETDSCLNWME